MTPTALRLYNRRLCIFSSPSPSSSTPAMAFLHLGYSHLRLPSHLVKSSLSLSDDLLIPLPHRPKPHISQPFLQKRSKQYIISTRMFSGLSLTRHLHSRVGDDDDSSTRIRAQNPSVEGGLPGSISEANEDVSSSFDEVSSKRPQDGRIEHIEVHEEVSESFIRVLCSFGSFWVRFSLCLRWPKPSSQ